VVPVDLDPDSDPEHWFTCLSVSSLSMEWRIWWAARGPGGPTYSCMSTLSRKARSMAPVRLEVVSTSTFRSFLTASTHVQLDAYSSTEQSADDHVVRRTYLAG
jgi:hypothetical protein